MNILLSSYSVNPYHGSEDGVGWNWTLQAAKHFNNPDDKIYLYTKKVNAKDTKKGIEENNLTNVELVITDTPDWLNWYREHNSAFHHIYYILWQRFAYRRAKKSGVDFDIVHHVTMGDFRITGCMWKLKKPYTVFGPVGGGQSTLKALKCYEGSKLTERVRELINKSRGVSPFYKRSINRFDAVYAVNRETQEIMEKSCRDKCKRLIEIALANEFANLNIEKKQVSSPVKILFLGRLIEKKGLMLLLDVARSMPKDADFVVEIYGSGPLEQRIKDYIKENNLGDRVKLCGTVSHTEVSDVYKSADIFVMPSLRETGGTVLVEAMAHKLPVAALDMSISRDLNEQGCGEFVNVNQSKDEIIKEFSDKLTTLVNNPDLREKEGANGYSYVNNELNWEKKFETVYADFIK